MQVEYKGFEVQVSEDGKASVNGQSYKSLQAAKLAITAGKVPALKALTMFNKVLKSFSQVRQSRNFREGRWLKERNLRSGHITRKMVKSCRVSFNASHLG